MLEVVLGSENRFLRRCLVSLLNENLTVLMVQINLNFSICIVTARVKLHLLCTYCSLLLSFSFESTFGMLSTFGVLSAFETLLESSVPISLGSTWIGVSFYSREKLSLTSISFWLLAALWSSPTFVLRLRPCVPSSCSSVPIFGIPSVTSIFKKLLSFPEKNAPRKVVF